VTANAVPYAVQALSHPADNFRRAQSFVCLGQQGVRSWVVGDMLVAPNGTPNMTVLVAAGQCLINGTQNTVSQGSYHGLNDASVSLAIAASDPTNPRIDIVVAQVRDAAYSGANNDFILAVVTGTPAGSPAAPATPNNAIVLAQVAVAANATTVTSGNITDKRPIFGSLLHAEVSQAGAQTIPNNVTTIIAFDTVTSDPTGSFTTGASAHYSVPVPGRYLVVARFAFTSTVNGSAIYCYLNGAQAADGDQPNVSRFVCQLSAAIRCPTAGQSLDIRALQNSGGGVNNNAPVYASFAYLGAL
jgi:hypothetical protein